MIGDELKIVLTRRWPESVEARLRTLGSVEFPEQNQPMNAEALHAAMCRADVVCPTVTDRLGPELFEGPLRVRLLANFGVGFNHIDLAAASAAGIAVTNTPGVLTQATAEIALSLMMMSARRASEGERLVRAGRWDGWHPTHMLSTAVSERTLGIVGMGRIGTAFARMAHHGLGMKIVAFNRSAIADELQQELGLTQLDLPQLLSEADFVSLHCPATPQTRHLIDAAALALMQPHAHLINTARGDIVDEAALVAALQQGTIAGAGLDVYEQEPRLSPGLTELQQVVLLPHMGSGTVQTRHAMGMCALQNIQAFAAGESLPNQVSLADQ